MKPDESLIANKIMGEVSSKEPNFEPMEDLKEIMKPTQYITRKSWGPKHDGSFHGDDTFTEEEVQQGKRKHRSFLDKILDEMVFCEPMSIGETQKRWEETWRKMSKEWQQEAMDRRRREQELKSKWNLFYGLTGITPPWSKENPREPEPWEPQF